VIMIGLAGSVVFYTLFGIATVAGSMTMLFVSRIGAGIAGATIPIAQAYIADTTTLQRRSKGMALIGMAFGIGFAFGPLIGFFAVPTGEGNPGPGPGYVAAGLSAVALLLAWRLLPESLHEGSESAARRIFDWQALRDALATPTIVPLLATIFLYISAFAMFETTLSLLMKGAAGEQTPFQFGFRDICLTFAFIGFVAAVVQGGIVRPLAGRIPEPTLAASGMAIGLVGFGLLVVATNWQSTPLLFVALAVGVSGIGFAMPSVNGMLSRRTNPDQQGGILGLGQSVNALARIGGSAIGLPLMHVSLTLPFFVAAGLMGVGLILVLAVLGRGHDFQASNAP